MKLRSILCVLILFSAISSAGYPLERRVHKTTAVSLLNVEVSDEFWSPRIETNQKVGIRHTFKACDHSLKNFDKAAGVMEGKHQGTCASDSDVYKIIEGAAYSLHHNPDSQLEDFVDKLIDRIIAAQQKDGYLYTFYTVNNKPEKRWADLRSRHQLYCAGHFIEAAVAYYEVTGKRKLLDAAIRLADLIDSIFGVGKRYEVPGHQEIELALVRLYRVTGPKRYLDLAKFFLDERGYAHGTERKPFDYTKAEKHGNKWLNRNGIMQDHKPIIEQLEPAGHAVRACYMYSGMIDVAGNIDSPGYVNAVDHIWSDVVAQRLYITGGVGSAEFHDEGFGLPYKLPNEKAYCETCAAMAFVFWNHRMSLLHGEAKYIDVMELSLYNGAISGISLSGDRFFYRNPLEVKSKYQRSDWFEPGCCPSNAVRFLPQVGKYIYTKDDNDIYVNLFVGNKADIVLGNNNVKLTQTTRYPWDGKIKIVVDPERAAKFGMNIRIPGWSVGKPVPSDLYRFAENQANQQPVSLKLNGKELQKLNISKGYAQLNRKWNKGDIIELDLPMPIRRVCGHPKLEAAAGSAALMRGPLVYCLEETDNSEYFKEGNQAYLCSEADSFKSEYQADLLGGVVTIKGEASMLTKPETIELTAVPYYSWCNRQAGKMRVWLPRAAPKDKDVRQADWKSLDARPVPEWWLDAKFGIFIHWGVYSVPAWSGGWYAEWYYQLMNQSSTGVAKRHPKVWGEDFKYPQFAPLFKAEKYDPRAWAKLFDEAGARYVVLTSKHHDGFCLWNAPDSKGWNAVDTGPGRDLIDPLARAVRAQGLEFGLYISLMEWNHGDGLPGNRYPKKGPEYVDKHLLPQIKDLVKKYQPTIMWPDGEWGRSASEWRSEEFLAWYVNNAANRDRIVWNDRWGNTRGKHGGFYTTEFGKHGKEGGAHPWEECRGIGGSFGYNSWYEDKDERYPDSQQLIDVLVTVVSRGGNLLLNIGPKADGTIIEVFQNRLRDIGRFLKVNGEAVYGSRLPHRSKQGDDIRFTRHKDNKTIYAFVKNKPGDSLTLNAVFAREGANVVLLADPKKTPLSWSNQGGNLTIKGIDQVSQHGEFYWVFRIPGGFHAEPNKTGE